MTFRALEQSAVPLYSQVRERLRERILDGTYAPHARLPAESEMGSIFGVSRITVRQALNDLQKEGVIFTVPGKGTFVAKARPSQELNRLEGFGEAMTRKGHRIVNQVLKHALVPAPPEVAAQLGRPAGAPVTEIHRLRYLDNAPVSFEITWLPPAVGERLRHEDLAGRDIFTILETDYAIALGYADIQIDAVNATPEQAALLGVAPGTALLRIERLTFTRDGAPLDYEHLYVRGEAFQYALRLPRHPQPF